MDARLNLFTNPVSAAVLKYLTSAGKVVSDSTLPAATQELVRLRASQINGCGFCTDMHTKDAAHAGETSTRLSLVAAWREAKVFTDAERAALELTEQGTRSPTRPVVSRRRPGQMPPSTTTRTSSPPWCPSSPSSTRSTAGTSSSSSPLATTSPASSDHEEYLAGTAGAVWHQAGHRRSPADPPLPGRSPAECGALAMRSRRRQAPPGARAVGGNLKGASRFGAPCRGRLRRRRRPAR